MKVRLNLATKALETHRRLLAASGVVGVIAGLLFLGLGWHVYAVRREDEALRSKTAEIRQEMVALNKQRQEMETFFAQPVNKTLHDRSAFLNDVIDEESLNWTQMFMDLERILPAGVRVTSIEPTHDKGRVQIKLVVDASTDEAKIKFLKALEESPAFKHVELVNEKKPTEGADGAEIQLTADYSKT